MFFRSATLLDGTFEATWSVWRRPQIHLGPLLGTLFGMLTGVHSQEIQFLFASRSRKVLQRRFGTLLGGSRRCFWTFLEIFLSLFTGVSGRLPRDCFASVFYEAPGPPITEYLPTTCLYIAGRFLGSRVQATARQRV